MKIPKYFYVNRMAKCGKYELHEIFEGLEKVPALKKALGSKLKPLLKKTIVKITKKRGYPWVSCITGNIIIPRHYLRYADRWIIYLDIIHEFIHVKQFHEGHELYHTNGIHYVRDPLEIEAYKIAISEGRRIGINENQIIDYLKVPWITKKESLKLMVALLSKRATSR